MNEIAREISQEVEIADLGNLDGPVLCFGGPYSNLQASEALLETAERLYIARQRMICTGDIVAYCGNPFETVELFRGAGVHIIQGNCEENLAQDEDDCGCGFYPNSTCAVLSERWFDFAKASLTSEQKKWMGRLPKRLEFKLAGRRFHVLHGSHQSISEFVFPSTDAEVKSEIIEETSADCVIGGHCGFPFTQQIGGKIWHNPGVIGLPANDGTKRTWYSILTPHEQGVVFEHHTLSYDADLAANRMKSLEFHDYGKTLVNGLYPSLSILPEQERGYTGIPISVGNVTWP